MMKINVIDTCEENSMKINVGKTKVMRANDRE